MKTRANYIELYYEMCGEGEPIVFAHGMMDDCTVWSSQVELLAKNHTVVTYDHRGYGSSDKPKGDYSVQTLANDLYSLIQELNLEKVTLVGHSLGGMTALIFTLDHPDKVSKLVLVDTAAGFSFGARAVARVFMPLFGIFIFVLPIKTVARLGGSFRFYKPSKQLIEDSVDRAMKMSKYAGYRCFGEFTGHYDIRERISEISVPTLIIVGDKDRATPLGMSQYMNSRITGSELQIMSDCSHMTMSDKPEEFNRILEEFIGQNHP